MRSWNPLAKIIRGVLRSRFHKQERKLIAALKKEVARSQESGAGKKSQTSDYRLPATKAPGIIARIFFDVFGDKEDRSAWQKRVRAFIVDAKDKADDEELTRASRELLEACGHKQTE